MQATRMVNQRSPSGPDEPAREAFDRDPVVAPPAAQPPASYCGQGFTSRPMRIAVIGGRGVPSNYSGIERIVESLFGGFAAVGHRITVFCRPQIPQQPNLTYRGLRQAYAPAPGGKTGETVAHSLFSMVKACVAGVDGHPFDLISMHALAPNLAVPIARLAGIPVISHVHGLDWQRAKWKGLGSRVIRAGERVMVRHSTAVIVVNRELQAYYRDTYGLATTLLPNGIHTTPDTLAPDRDTLDRFGLRPGRFVVSIGRLVPEKRVEDTIAAFGRLNARNLKLALAGDGSSVPEYLTRLKSLAAELGSDPADDRPRVVFTGLVDGAPLETLFRQAACYVSASELEGLPMSLLECADRATLPIVTRIPPHEELLGGVSPYDAFFQVGDVEQLAHLMNRALSNPEHTALVAAAARRYVRQEYGWPVLAQRTERFYQHVLGRVRGERTDPLPRYCRRPSLEG